MQYMLLIYSSSDAPAIGTPEQADEHAAYFEFTQEVLAAGVMKSGAPLQDVETATTVRVRGGDRLVTDGPFAETKDLIAGWMVIDVDSEARAIELAGELSAAPGPRGEPIYEWIEIRPFLALPETFPG